MSRNEREVKGRMIEVLELLFSLLGAGGKVIVPNSQYDLGVIEPPVAVLLRKGLTVGDDLRLGLELLAFSRSRAVGNWR